MKSINYLKIPLLAIFFSAYLTGCDEEDTDLTPPSLNNVTLNGQAENIQVNPGEDLVFEANISDNQQLGQLKIDIHDNFDGHTHGRLTAILATPFVYDEVINLTGTTQSIEKEIEIPGDAATGPYHFIVQFFDAAGNEGELQTLEFEIVDESEQPSITVTSPDFSTETEVSPGNSFLLSGTVSDPDGLEELHIMIIHEEENGHDHDHGRIKDSHQDAPLWEKEWELEGAEESTFNEQISISSSAETGHYIIRIMAMDVNNNVKILKGELHVEQE